MALLFRERRGEVPWMTMFQKIEIRNVACIRRVEVDLQPFHAFIGPNDSGKSTILSCVRALTIRASGGEPSFFSSERSGPWIRGTTACGTFTIEKDTSNQLETSGLTPDLKVEIGLASVVRFDADALRKPSGLIPESEHSKFLDERGAGLPGIYQAILGRGDDTFLQVTAELRRLFPTIKNLRVPAISKDRNRGRAPPREAKRGVKVFLAGEGATELGDWAKPSSYRPSDPTAFAPGVIAALLSGRGAVVGAVLWKSIRKYRRCRPWHRILHGESRGDPARRLWRRKGALSEPESLAHAGRGGSRAAARWRRFARVSVDLTPRGVLHDDLHQGGFGNGEGTMEYRRLGSAGVKVSALGLGGWLTYGNAIVDEGEVAAILRAAFDAGIDFFDIADVYGRGEAERLMGRALRDVPRHRLVISTKVYWPMTDDVNDRGLSRKHVMESVEKSLARIGTDYLDVYFCHRHDEEAPLEETARAMDDLVHQGKILYWGTSEWSGEELRAAHGLADRRNLYPPAVEQPEYSLIVRERFESDVRPAAAELGMGLVVWSPLASGMLTGKYDEGLPQGSRLERHAWLREEYHSAENVARVRRLKAVADRLGVTRAQLALAWALRQPGVSSAITGASSVEQLRENLRALEVPLDDGTVRELGAMFPVA